MNLAIIQVIIAVTGVTAIWLSQQPNLTLRKYASLLGLISQPFWFISSAMTEQWGIFILCIFYTYAWGVGVHTNWIKPYLQSKVTD